MTNKNDLDLCAHLLRVEQGAKKLEELERDGRRRDLWNTLEAIATAAQLAQFRLLDIEARESGTR